ncbi:hypothetical protein K438DRAFT_2025252 [Mycena galopus ATCC 62051]|nr:hypothetical protein K438DRAFT_2025252 [Mycena galopus ATCC 62051]
MEEDPTRELAALPPFPPSAKALGKRRRIEPDSAGSLPVQTIPFIPRSASRARPFPRSMSSLHSTQVNSNEFSTVTDRSLPGHGTIVTPMSLAVLPVLLQDTPVGEFGDCDRFVSTFSLNKLYRCVKVQSARLAEIASSHRLQSLTRPAILAAAIIGHECSPLCPGYDVMLFERLDLPRTVEVSSHPELEVIHDNDPRDDEPGSVST